MNSLKGSCQYHVSVMAHKHQLKLANRSQAFNDPSHKPPIQGK